MPVRTLAAAAVLAAAGLTLTGFSAADAAPSHHAAVQSVSTAQVAVAPAPSRADRNALAQAKQYDRLLHLSKAALYDQLHSRYGGRFSKAASRYAVDHVHANWNRNALLQARQYDKTLHLSPAALYDQLVSKYGGKFTKAQAKYAVKHL